MTQCHVCHDYHSTVTTTIIYYAGLYNKTVVYNNIVGNTVLSELKYTMSWTQADREAAYQGQPGADAAQHLPPDPASHFSEGGED